MPKETPTTAATSAQNASPPQQTRMQATTELEHELVGANPDGISEIHTLVGVQRSFDMQTPALEDTEMTPTLPLLEDEGQHQSQESVR